MPTSLSNLTDLADLKLDLNDFSGVINSAITTWPIFSTPKTTTTVLFGNLWSCLVPNTVREHSNEDPNHAYSCGGSEFVTPVILAAAAGTLFVVAASFTKKCERVISLIGTYTRGRCIVLLVVICNIGFFGTAALMAGVNVGEDERGGGVWTIVFLAVMVGALWSQIAVLSNRGGGCGNFFVRIEVKEEGGGKDENVVSSPMQDDGDGIELKEI
ncbi:hypothetical protein TrLO_g3413 [Triparma laevis f. longispina]|uniref:Uncharacterized protein n=1 Tax=Triparma laevis f. longispina TaxID=1714387 RepID=A0A9W7CM27_9STRA|nr:hypothetical protein TrLO_g3413 [Triparma laevis f. longispina]